jgi:hypothetical protein
LSLGKISSSLQDENPSGFIPMENLNGNWEGMGLVLRDLRKL